MRLTSRHLPAILGYLALLAPLTSAGVLNVPGTYPTIQLAIDAANPGDTIEVAGGTYGPITIDKQLTILETAPGVVIDNTVSFPTPFVPAAITLAGPGSGSVILSGVDTQGTTDGTLYGQTGSGIEGGGFGSLYIHDASIRSAEWGTELTGLAVGKPAINVSVPFVVISRSTVIGGQTLIDECDFFANLPPSGEGVYAPFSTVVVEESKIEGGKGGDLCFNPPFCPPLGPSLGAVGGVGVVADCLFAQIDPPDAYIRGGLGGDVTCGATLLGSQPSGTDWIANNFKLMPQILTFEKDADLKLGGTLELELAPASLWGGGAKLMLLGFPTAPVNLYADGYLFMDPLTMKVRGTALPGGPFSIAIPSDPTLVGIQVALQFWSPLSKLTDPYIAVVEP